jgi:hypothetical protein
VVGVLHLSLPVPSWRCETPRPDMPMRSQRLGGSQSMWCRYHLTVTPQRAVAWENTKSGGVGHTAPSWRHSGMFQVRRWRLMTIISA